MQAFAETRQRYSDGLKKTFQIKVLPLLIRIICINFAAIINDFINLTLNNGPF
jgi:hypothetical protein